MDTRLIVVDAANPQLNDAELNEAAQVIRDGGVVAFPTETVYGLGADAFNEAAVRKVFAAKNRPADNPLIVHIANFEGLKLAALEVNENAQRLMDAFWPGPLTIIMPKQPTVPDVVSGRLDTVGVRMPSNPVAQRFIKLAGTPIAAPSANASTKPSTTRASHVEFDLHGKIDMIIDGGASEYGLESTIVDVSHGTPRLLRPGSITLEMLEEVLGQVEYTPPDTEVTGTPIAPGMKYKHYSPQAEIVIVSGGRQRVAERINMLVEGNSRCGVITTVQNQHLYKCENVIIVGDELEPATIAANLFKVLRRCDYLRLQTVYCEDFSRNPLGMAIMNRLNKAAGQHVIAVD